MSFAKRLTAGAALSVLASAWSCGVYAQETTSGVQGRVSGPSGAGVANAAVSILHQPTGTRITTVTDTQGYFAARGLRVGGPYIITVTAGGATASRTLVSIGVGEEARADVALAGGSAVDEVVVVSGSTGAADRGLSTNFRNQQIQSLPSVSRDIKDIARLDVFATLDPGNSKALSFAGTNTRFNQLTVDGIRQNDDFGLNNNGYPTQRSPISLDAIQSLQVSIAPFSVINNGFLGGSINAVTKSGSNEFHGSIYGEYTSDAYRGDSIRGAAAGGKFSEKNYGLTFGGPILKDRLFFFLAYEKYEGELALDEGPADSGRSVVVPRITSGAIDTFQGASRNVYGYDPGTWVKSVPPVEDEKWIGRIDWNITDAHRVSLTFQDTRGTSFNGATADLFSNGSQTTRPRVGLTTYQYLKDEHLSTYNVQLNSSWRDNLSTELRLGHKETDTLRLVPALEVGEITVGVADLPGVTGGIGVPELRFGTDINSQPNYLNVFTDTAEGIVRYQLREHRLLAGLRSERQDITNIFGRQFLGTYGFTTYADFLNRRATSFALTGAVNPTGGTVPAVFNTAAQAAGKIQFRLDTLYFEDNIQVLDNLSVLAGLRYDRYSQDGAPVFNASFLSRNGFSNQQNVDGMDILLPRAYLNWRPTDRMTVTFGHGRFSSQGLNVWIQNPWANDGVRQVNAVCPAGPYLNANLRTPPAGCTLTPGNGNTNVLDPNLKIPNVWKTTFSVGYNFNLGPLGDDWRIQGDAIYQTNHDYAIQRDLRSVQVGVAPDGRPIYGRTTTGVIGANVFDMMLTNVSDGGFSRSVAVSLAKAWSDGWLDGLSINANYAYTRAEDRNPMTSSIADSSYVRFASFDHQNPSLAISDYEVRHKFAVQFNYGRKVFGDNETRISIYAQSRSGLPFSYTFDNSRTGSFDNDFGNLVTQSYSGRQANSNQLLYVPAAAGGSVTATSDARVTYGPGFDVAAFDQFLKNTGLINYSGGIAPRNAFRTKRVNTVDLRLSQELPAFIPGAAKITGFFDIENVGNLLNDKWGIFEQYDFYKGVPVVDTRIVNGQYVYSGLRTAPGTTNQAIRPFNIVASSLWTMKFGLKYSF